MSNKLLIINQVTGPFFVEVVNRYVSMGHSVTLLSGQIEELNSKIDERVEYIRLQRYSKISWLNRIASWSVFSLQVLYYLRKTSFNDLVLSTNPPWLIWLGLMKKTKLTVFILDLYPETLEAINWNVPNVIIRYWQKLNQMVLNSAEQRICVSSDMASYCQTFYGLKFDKVYPVIRPLDNKEILLTNKFLIVYTGNIGISHPFESFLELAQYYENDDRFEFHVCGHGVNFERLIKFSKRIQLRNIYFSGRLSSVEYDSLLKKASIAYAGNINEFSLSSIPSRVLTYLTYGLYVVADVKQGSDLSRLLEENNVGCIVHTGEIEKAISQIEKHVAIESAEKKEKIKSIYAKIFVNEMAVIQ